MQNYVKDEQCCQQWFVSADKHVIQTTSQKSHLNSHDHSQHDTMETYPDSRLTGMT